MSVIAEKVGARIKMLRVERRLTQEQLAFEADMHPAYIGQIERGEKSPTLDTLEKIVKALDVEFSELFQTKPRGPSLPDDCNQELEEFLAGLSSSERSDLYAILWMLKKWKGG